MKKYIGKFFLIFAILFGFVGGFAFLSTTNFALADGEIHSHAEPTKISSAAQIEQLVINWDKPKSQTNYVLTNDIDFATETSAITHETGIVLHDTFGNDAFPFLGIFDGNGYKISNLKIDLTTAPNGNELNTTNKYFGLFGVTNGATIKNLALAGTTEVTVGKCTNAYVGALVGKAKDTNISFVQNAAKISFKDDAFLHNVCFGGLAGTVSDSEISYFTSRQTDFGTWTLNDNNNKTHTVGGVAGSLNNTKIKFGISSNVFKITEGESFYGNLILGGIAGTISQNGSQVFNFVLENNHTITERQTNILGTFTVGQIIGRVLDPAPEVANISYIYFKTNTSSDAFGFEGEYDSEGSVLSSISTIPVSVNDFSSKAWHVFLGGWDFGTIWNEGATASLQAFSGNFSLSMSANSVIDMVDSFSSGYRYGTSATISFKFKEVTENSSTIKMANYYTITAIALGVNDVVRLTETDGVYTMSDSEKYEFSVDNGKFYLKVKEVNNSTSGVYSIKTQAKQFDINVTSKLFTGDRADEFVENITPGYVYHTKSPVPQEVLPTIKLGYDSNAVTLDTRLKDPKSAYAFLGWYMENPGGNDIELTTNSTVLTINFGHGVFTGSSNIYAKYQDDACVFTFKIDEGVKEVDLFRGSTTIQIKETNESVAISKKETSVRLEIYTKENFDFDVQEFLTVLDIYKSSDGTKAFCLYDEEESRPLENKYVFKLDMTNLTGDAADALNIDVQTKEAKKGLGNALWYIIGGAGGAFVIILVIILVVVIKKRNGGFGGGMGKSSFGKKSFKDMYY